MPPEKFSEEELLQIFSSMMGPESAPPAAPPPPIVAAPPPIVAAPPSLAAAPPPPTPVAPPPAARPSARPAPAAPAVPVAPPPPPTAPTLPAPPTAPPAPPGQVAGPTPEVAPAPAVPITPEDLKTVDDLGHQFEIGRVRMQQVLSPFISEKVAKKMLAWSLDRAQKTHPIFKNVHWSPAGELLDNGEVEVARLVKNAEGSVGQPVVQLVKLAFQDLLVIRLEAVEKGLGPSMKLAVDKEVARLRDILK